ncbi:MAG: class I SAM-dependent methyltransferase [Schwartzia sp.]|nr:class I SAM-dependent methyltransferase [Schwartzia sp. (in: firmicutes)]
MGQEERLEFLRQLVEIDVSVASIETMTPIYNQLIEMFKDEKYIDYEEAVLLFRFIEQAPRGSLAAYKFLFDICAKSSVALPMESYLYTIKIFEEQPRLLSNPNNIHPEYEYRPSAQRTFEHCPICGGDGTPYYRAFAYYMINFAYPHLPTKLWMKCDKCGNLYTWCYPEDLLAKSNSNEIVYPDARMKYTAMYVPESKRLSVWCKVLNKVSKLSGGHRLLEVGIGSGECLAVALELGFDTDAVEIDRGTAQRVANILGIPIWRGDFLNYSPDNRYSVITMGDVIEHIIDPEAALTKAWDLLEERGVLWLSTPNFESSFSRMMKFDDAMWLTSNHITYFSLRGIESLIKKCGFEICEYNISERYNGSMELILMKTS